MCVRVHVSWDFHGVLRIVCHLRDKSVITNTTSSEGGTTPGQTTLWSVPWLVEHFHFQVIKSSSRASKQGLWAFNKAFIAWSPFKWQWKRSFVFSGEKYFNGKVISARMESFHFLTRRGKKVEKREKETIFPRRWEGVFKFKGKFAWRNLTCTSNEKMLTDNCYGVEGLDPSVWLRDIHGRRCIKSLSFKQTRKQTKKAQAEWNICHGFLLFRTPFYTGSLLFPVKLT